MGLSPRLAKLLYAWEAVQVELQGRYSLPRFREVLDHAKHAAHWRHGVTVLLTPLPCLTFLILLDKLPIRAPSLGFEQQTIWVVVRLSIVAWVMGFMMSKQIHQSSPTLPYPVARQLGIPTVVATIIGFSFCALSVTLGFPVPFGIQLLTPLWFVLLTSLLWNTWKHAIRADAEARANLVSYIPVFIIQVAIVYAYPLFNVAFTSSSPAAQPYVSIGLPIMKLIFKNLMSKGVFRMEDLAPTTIVLNMDVFHAMFVSSTMQQAQTRGTTVVIMVTDLIQSLIAYAEVHQVLMRVNRLARECQALEPGFQVGNVSALASQRALRRGAIDYALFVIDNYPTVRNHPEVVFPRHHKSRVEAPAEGPNILLTYSSRILPLASPMPLVPSASSKSPLSTDLPNVIAPLSDTDRLQLECVKNVLKMLHMIEFYVLIEFAEVLVAIMYTIYMFVIARLPNHVYYKQLAPLSTDELDARVVHLAIYSGLELVSFVLFCWVIDRKVRHLSTIQQLAFVLEKHALVVQTTIFMWVFFLVQLSLEHFGSDYSFKFAWLHKNAHATSPQI